MAAPSKRRRRGRRGYEPARCKACRGRIRWFRLRGRFVKFDPRPIDTRTHVGAAAYPTEGQLAWPLSRLVEELMGRREITSEAAMAEAYDFPWFAIHVCRRDTP